MRILVVNDDGIDASGIVMLAKAARTFGDVTVVAPMGQRSAKSQSITVHGDVVAAKAGEFPVDGVSAWKISGTPADCVRVGLWYAMKERPDLVLSGINAGFNTGYDIVYSGTVGAAKEAVMNGIPAIAFSIGDPGYLGEIEEYLEPMIRDLAARPIEAHSFWNVNFPKCRREEIKGVLEDRFPAPEVYFQTKYIPKGEEADGMHLEIRMTYPEKLADGCDIQALFDGYISVGKVGHIVPETP